ncbi:hypothetical protein ACWJN0_22740, partial [Escherichia coli]
GTADRNRSHWSTSKTPSYTKSVSWQHHQRVLRFVFSFMRKHPQVKHTTVNGLHKLGLYQPAYRLYRRMNPLPHSQYQADAQILSQTELQVMHPELLPPVVYEIYLKLTKNK